MRTRVPVLMVPVALAAGACTADGDDKAPSDDAGESGPGECFEERPDEGELEVTDSIFTVINPDADGDYKVSYAIEVTNNSESDTAMVAGLGVEFVDDGGEPVMPPRPSPGVDAYDLGQVYVLAPGEHKYFAGTLAHGLPEVPADMEVTLPADVRFDTDREATYWLPDAEVDYPSKLEAELVDLGGDPTDKLEPKIRIENDSDDTVEYVEVVTVLRDSEGKLLGGQYSGPSSDHAKQSSTAPPGSSELFLFNAFRDGLPPGTDTSNIEFQVTSQPRWTELDKHCDFDFDRREH